jgi:hypothetical protein
MAGLVGVASGRAGQVDERLVPDLPRGKGRSIDGDLNVGEEDSK